MMNPDDSRPESQAKDWRWIAFACTSGFDNARYADHLVCQKSCPRQILPGTRLFFVISCFRDPFLSSFPSVIAVTSVATMIESSDTL
jgi:hypothetical protein